MVALCLAHGATFLALKVDGEVRDRARMVARRTAPLSALAVLVFVFWTQAITGRGVIPGLVPAVGVLAAAGTALLVRRGAGGLGLHRDHRGHGGDHLDDLPQPLPAA